MGENKGMIAEKQNPSVAIVLVNYNGFEFTKECIESLFAIDYLNYQIVLINNGSTDQSGSLLNSYFNNRIVYIDKFENKGVTAGNNGGIEYALNNQFDYVLLLNNDTLVSPNFLTCMVETSCNNSNSMVVPKIRLYYDQTRLDFWNGTGFNWWSSTVKGFRYFPFDGPEYNTSYEIKLTSTCCLLVPTKIFRTIGVMDEKYFMYFDDADFTIRATRSGFKIIYEPSSIILHKGGMSSKVNKASYFQFYLMKRNIFLFYSKLCPSNIAKYYSYGKFIFINSLLGLKYLFTGNHNKLSALMRAQADFFYNRLGVPPKL